MQEPGTTLKQNELNSNLESQITEEESELINKQVELKIRKMQIAFELRNLANLESLYLDIKEQVLKKLSTKQRETTINQLSDKYELNTEDTEKLIRIIDDKPNWCENYLSMLKVLRKFYSKDLESYLNKLPGINFQDKKEDKTKLEIPGLSIRSMKAVVAYTILSAINQFRSSAAQFWGGIDFVPDNLIAHAFFTIWGENTINSAGAAIEIAGSQVGKPLLGMHVKNPLVEETRNKFIESSYQIIHEAQLKKPLDKKLLSKIMKHQELARKQIGPFLNCESEQSNLKEIELNKSNQDLAAIKQEFLDSLEDPEKYQQQEMTRNKLLQKYPNHYQEGDMLQNLIEAEFDLNEKTREKTTYKQRSAIKTFKLPILIGSFFTTAIAALKFNEGQKSLGNLLLDVIREQDFNLEDLQDELFERLNDVEHFQGPLGSFVAGGEGTARGILNIQNLVKEIAGDIPESSHAIASYFDTLELLIQGNYQALEQKYGISTYESKLGSTGVSQNT